MTTVESELILASAGTGKTHQLVCRYLRLLALNVPPHSIAAMTFTRKAAGEFFERILQGLASAADDPSRAPEDTHELRTLSRQEVIALLRTMIQNMDRLRLGTIDSFLASMVQSVPFELGLSGDVTLLSDAERLLARDQTLDALLRVTRNREDEMRQLAEAWKRSTFGKDDNQPVGRMDGWFRIMHDWLMACREDVKWGGAHTIWPGGSNPYIAAAGGDLKTALAVLKDRIDPSQWKSEPRYQYWQKFFDAIERHEPGGTSDSLKPITNMLDPKRIVGPGNATHGDLRLGDVEWKLDRTTVTLGREACNALADVLEIVIGRELAVRCQRTRGRYALISRFESLYQTMVRSQGRLVFSDMAWLLSGRFLEKTDARETWDDLRLHLEHRLDARYDHWLLDEFQDTSTRQWNVIQNLLSEVLQSNEGTRTLFVVGDLKQSIYLWREAEPALFRHVQDRFAEINAPSRSLTCSYRSGQAVLDTVNLAFRASSLAGGAARWWTFEEHASAANLSGITGHAAFLTLPKGEEEEETAHDQLVVALLKHLRPLERGLSCAVLTRVNSRAVALAARLRSELQVEVICESESLISQDNPAVPVLISLIQWMAHPGDFMAREHLLMSPLSSILPATELKWTDLSAELRSTMQEEGFLGVLTPWTQKLHEAGGIPDDFTEQRVSQFLELAAAWDATGSRNLEGFLNAARDHTLREDSSGEAVQVMTIHKSKGLEFDIVIYADLHRRRNSGGRQDELLIQKDDAQEVSWLLDSPPSAILKLDPVLSAAQAMADEREDFENWCNRYVAMTRARRALYLTAVADDNKDPTKGTDAHFFSTSLGGGNEYWNLGDVTPLIRYETGDRSWTEALPLCEVAVAETTLSAPADASGQPLAQRLRELVKPLQRRTPSGEEAFAMMGSELLSTNRESGRNTGLLVHELFATVPWLEDKALTEEGWMQVWSAKGLATQPGFTVALEHARRVLHNTSLQPWFRRSSSEARVAWIERRFDMVVEHEWISGILDRVVLERTADGTWTSATILDFKTDHVTDDASIASRAAGYAPQLHLYRRAVATLTGLPPEKIATGLIFTSAGCLHWVV